jgi:hypothetical protein
MKRDTDRPVALEELLRLKRAERPPAEFWEKFDSEMRAKQLAAIVAKRPWWDGASVILAPIYRHHLSFGAAAAVALTWTGVHYLGMPTGAGRGVPAAPATAVAAVAPARTAPPSIHAVAPRAAALTVDVAAVERPVAVSHASHVTQAPATAPAEAPPRAPFGEGLAISLADFRTTVPAVAGHDIFGSDREFEQAPSQSQQVSEPLATIDPSAERRARLLAPALPSYPGNARSLASDWMKNRAANDRMYESMDLYGSSDRAVVGFRF